MQTLNSTQTYDVIIMGGGFAGLCQARHLLLKVPNIKIAVVDPRPTERDSVKDLKIGESTVEVAAMFLAKELGLWEYLVEKQVPKFGLNFHWPKTVQQTESLDDYYHIWTNRQPPIASFQLDRSEFETDLIKMNSASGVEYIQGKVIDVELTTSDELNIATIKSKDGKFQLSAKHIIDAAGRRFIIGKKVDNLLQGPDNLFGLDNGASWLRVKNVDRTLFHDGFDPDNSATSHYYATNHFFGHGHWFWMIPIDTENHQLSIGMMHHHKVIPSQHVNSQEKLLTFIKSNHEVLYNLIQSGEIVDSHYWPRVAHKSKTMFSEDNWYVIGDAACIYDAFYSQGSTLTTFAIESTTEIIRSKLANEADAEKKRESFNNFLLAFNNSVNTLYARHDQQLGNASIMSWRIYWEYIWWFGVIIPLYMGKWHLDTDFSVKASNILKQLTTVLLDVSSQFGELVEKKTNLGLLDCYRADQLIFGYYTPKHFDDFTENAKYEPQRLNIFRSIKSTCFYAIVWMLKFCWESKGFLGLFQPRNIKHIGWMVSLMFQSALGEMLFNFKHRNTPDNTSISLMRQEFKTYEFESKYLYPDTLVDGSTDLALAKALVGAGDRT